jgi:hypothetical protein
LVGHGLNPADRECKVVDLRFKRGIEAEHRMEIGVLISTIRQMCGGCIFVVTLILNLLKNIVVFIVIPRFL